MALIGTAAVITAVRDTLNDTVATYRWSSEAMRRYIYDGEMMILKSHPECQYDTAVAVATDPTLYTATDGDTTLPERWRVPLEHYVVFRCLLEDADDAATLDLAKEHYGLFTAEVE